MRSGLLQRHRRHKDSPMRKPPQTPVATQKSFAFRREMQIGAAIADKLKPVMTLDEVAERTGLSKSLIRRTEHWAFRTASLPAGSVSI